MVHLSVLLTRHYRPISLAAILDVFETVNRFYLEEEGRPFFEIQLVSAEEEAKEENIYNTYRPQSLSAAGKTDIVLIPAFASGNMQEFIQNNRAFIPWLQQQFKKGVAVGSFCTGAFLLGSTGLLNGRKATTHISVIPQFSSCFPEVQVLADEVVTDDGGIYTSGGATSSFNLMLYLVEKYCRREIAIRTAKLFAIDMDRERQSHFAENIPARHHSDNLVAEAQRRMEQDCQNGINVEDVIRNLPASRRNFVRRFKVATGLTPIEYLQRIRIEAAKKALEQKNQTLTGAMIAAGYSDAKAFRQVFKRMVGLTPAEYRDKYAGKVKKAVTV